MGWFGVRVVVVQEGFPFVRFRGPTKSSGLVPGVESGEKGGGSWKRKGERERAQKLYHVHVGLQHCKWLVEHPHERIQPNTL